MLNKELRRMLTPRQNMLANMLTLVQLSRFSMSSQYSPDNSISNAARLYFNATLPVVPKPAKKSQTTPPSGHPAKMQFLI